MKNHTSLFEFEIYTLDNTLKKDWTLGMYVAYITLILVVAYFSYELLSIWNGLNTLKLTELTNHYGI